MKYNAFISYRHGELDGLVAEKLHRMLETYRIPKKIAAKIGRNRIERVFRDRDELPTSSDLSGSIDDALQNSEYLILICSRRTKESMWVMREVERFAELHGQERIIALLIEGEPDEAFPEQIRTRMVNGEKIAVEPLAADIRAESWAKSLQLLKGEKLRIIAPVLGCGFDDLKQRHRERKIKRITAVSAITAAGILTFGSFSFYQYLQINEQMKMKLENQSYVLAEYSNGVLNDGDPLTAAMLALEALPKNLENPERALVEAAEKSLADALRYYHVRDGFDYHRLQTLPAAVSKVLVSPGGTYTVALYPYQMAIIDNESGKVKSIWDCAATALLDAEFLADDIIVFSGRDRLNILDIGTNCVLWSPEAIVANEIAISADMNVIAAVNTENDYAVFYDRNGTETRRVNFNGRYLRVPNDTGFLNPHDNIFELDEKGETLAVSFTNGEIVLFDEKGEHVIYSNSEAVHFSGFFSGGNFMYSTVARSDYKAELGIYSLSDNTLLMSLESFTGNFIVSKDNKSGELFYANGNYIVSVDPDNNRRIVASFNDGIKNFAVYDGVFLTSTKSGDYYFYDRNAAPQVRDAEGNIYPMPDGGRLTAMESNYICDFLSIGKDYAATGGYDSLDVRILKNKSFEDKNILTYDTSYQWSEAGINEMGDRIALFSYRGFRLIDADSGSVVAEVEFPDSEKIVNVEHYKATGAVIAVYGDAFRTYSGQSGELGLEVENCTSVFLTENGIHYLKDGVVRYYSGEGEISENAGMDADFGLLLGSYAALGRNGELFLKNRSLGAEQSLGKRKLGAVCSLGGDNYRLALVGEDIIEVYSIEDGAVIFSFNIEIKGACDLSFVNNGDSLAVMPYHGTPYVYDVGSAKKATDLRRDGYLAKVYNLGDGYVASTYVSATGKLYSLILDSKTFQPLAEVPWLCDYMPDGGLLINDEAGNLRAVKVHDTGTLVKEAEELLNGRELTQAQRDKYHV